MAWLALWWITEIVPIPVTSLLPMMFIPLLGLSFADWMILGLPLALTMLLVCWLWLTKFHFLRPTNDSGQNDTPTQLKVLGLMSRS